MFSGNLQQKPSLERDLGRSVGTGINFAVQMGPFFEIKMSSHEFKSGLKIFNTPLKGWNVLKLGRMISMRPTPKPASKVTGEEEKLKLRRR
jgi:hypothetical protein